MLRRSPAASSTICVFLFVVLFLGYWQRNWLGDWLRLQGYHAPAAVVAIASDDGMTAIAQRYLYVNHPVIQDKAAFNAHCLDPTEQRAVLGCYLGNRNGIYLYNVTDSRLAGVEQVTAAHEMLHQAYDRLSSPERTRINTLLLDYYNNKLADKTVKDKIASYPNDMATRLNEMHSIFGTEVSNLPAALETYYAQYFTNRTKVVTFAQAYQAHFAQIQQQVATYDQQLTDLKAQIDSSETDLRSRLTVLSDKKQSLSQYQAAHDPSGYNVLVREYNSLVQAYNAELTTTKQSINTYNTVVAARNTLTVQESELQQALDSRLNPVTNQ